MLRPPLRWPPAFCRRMAGQAAFVRFRLRHRLSEESGRTWELSGTARIRTENQGIMLTTSTFAAPFGFVVWTIPSPCGVCRLVSTPSAGWRLGSGLAWLLRVVAFPEFGRFYRSLLRKRPQQPV